jgi:transposase
MRLGFTNFPPRFGRGLPKGKRQSFEPRSTTTISRPSVAPVRAGKLYMHVYEQPISGEEVVSFLRHVLREVSGKLTIIWDGLPAHRGQAVKEFLREGASRRLHLERLPGYAPDLNPDEGVWNYLENVEMKNLCCQGLDHLKTELRKAKERLRHKTQIIKSFFREVGLV